MRCRLGGNFASNIIIPKRGIQSLSFTSPDGKMVSEFEKTHEKLVHLIIVREGLDHFAHLHPEVDSSGNITTDFTFPVGGRYLFFADYKSAGEAPAVARGEVYIGGDAPAAAELTPNVPGRVSGDGLTAEVLVEAGGGAGGETEISFALREQGWIGWPCEVRRSLQRRGTLQRLGTVPTFGPRADHSVRAPGRAGGDVVNH